MKNKISVIVPIYNVELYLKKCIDSILNQTYSNLEIILVDDGSTDSSGEICDTYANKKNVVIIHKKNGGLSSARNAGLDVATGKYISFIDSDDYIEPDMYEKMISVIEKTDKDIACCGRIVNVYGSHENVEFTVPEIKEYTKTEAIRQVLLLGEIDVSACDKIYKKELFNKIRYPEGKISEDAAIIMELLNQSNGVVHAAEPFYHYVLRKRSISKSSYSVKNLDVLENIKSTEKYINKYYSELNDDYKIYACLTSAAQLILINGDKQAKKQFQTAYLELKKYFNDGYKQTKKRSNITFKKKLELFFIKHNLISLYNIMKNVYQIKYKLTR